MADLYLKALQSERQRLWAECRLKGLAKGTSQRNRIQELDKLLSEHRNKSAAEPPGIHHGAALSREDECRDEPPEA